MTTRTTSLGFVMAVCSLAAWPPMFAISASAQTPSEWTLRTMHTPGGVTFGVWGPVDVPSPAATLIVLATDIESTLGSAYYRQCGNILARHGYLCVSIDLPCHGLQRREGEPEGLAGWRVRAERGDDFVAENNQRLADVVGLPDQGTTDGCQSHRSLWYVARRLSGYPLRGLRQTGEMCGRILPRHRSGGIAGVQHIAAECAGHAFEFDFTGRSPGRSTGVDLHR